jgi:hypothetical protein
MATVLMTFYNEEYLLPWWINHHKKLFEHGILIDYHSTDRSYEICKELCPPNWQIVKSMNNDFASDGIDSEYQYYEKTVGGFKMPLTTAEFLLTPLPLYELDAFCIKNQIDYFRAHGVCMVDTNTNELPTYDKNLYEQKHHGMIEGYIGPKYTPIPDYFWFYFSRCYHNKEFGDYAPGRHWLNNSYYQYRAKDVFVLKYKYSPWNPTTISRIQQFKSRVPQSDLDENKGHTHCMTEEQYVEEYEHFLSTAHDLKENSNFLAAFNYCNSL